MFNPFGIVANGTEQWQSDPVYRGTYGILSTYLLTMGLCIWTAVHLNMTDGHSAMVQTGRKIGWLVIGLFAPELIAWTAFQQNKDAVELTRNFEATFRQRRAEGTLARLTKALSVAYLRVKDLVDLAAGTHTRWSRTARLRLMSPRCERRGGGILGPSCIAISL